MQFTWTTSDFNNNRDGGKNAILIRYQRRINEGMDGKLYMAKQPEARYLFWYATIDWIAALCVCVCVCVSVYCANEGVEWFDVIVM